MFTFLLVLQALIAAGLVTVILIQRSEGGGFTGGSPSGLMSARGAADFLTRATAILATAFVLCCIALATLAAMNQRTGKIDASAATPVQSAPAPAAAPTTIPTDPLAAAAGQATGNGTPPAPAGK
jgi:preprotein translocase subunit SecG